MVKALPPLAWFRAFEAAARHLSFTAAAEEIDHLAWCEERLQQLDSRPSALNPLWYSLSYAVGAAAGASPVPRCHTTPSLC